MNDWDNRIREIAYLIWESEDVLRTRLTGIGKWLRGGSMRRTPSGRRPSWSCPERRRRIATRRHNSLFSAGRIRCLIQ